MAKRMTAATIEQVKPGAARRELPDKGCPGLYLVVQPNGTKSWAVRFRSPVEIGKDGQRKAKKLTLGPLLNGEGREGEPKIGLSLTLAEARALATAALDRVAKGIDPTHERRAERSKFRKTAAGRDSVDTVFERFMRRAVKKRSKEPLRESTRAEYQRIYDKRIKPRWKDRPVSSLVKRDILELLEEIVDEAPILANRTLALVRRFLNWCVAQDIIAASPCAGIETPAPETSRDRVLSDDELRVLWKASEADGYPFGPLVKMLILTGQRVNEVRAAPRAEFDTDNRLWTIPKERAKNNREHTVWLADPTIEIIKKLPRFKPRPGKPLLMFTTTGESPVSGMSRAKERLDAAMLAELRKCDKKATPEPWRFHDVRRTVYSGLQRLGFPIEIAEAVTNHISGTLKGVAGVYAKHKYSDEKARALEAWAREVDRIVSGKTAKVVPIKARA